MFINYFYNYLSIIFDFIEHFKVLKQFNFVFCSNTKTNFEVNFVDKDFFGGFFLNGEFSDFFALVADRISLGVSKLLDGLFIAVFFNRVSEATLSDTYFSFTAILC